MADSDRSTAGSAPPEQRAGTIAETEKQCRGNGPPCTGRVQGVSDRLGSLRTGPTRPCGSSLQTGLPASLPTDSLPLSGARPLGLRDEEAVRLHLAHEAGSLDHLGEPAEQALLRFAFAKLYVHRVAHLPSTQEFLIKDMRLYIVCMYRYRPRPVCGSADRRAHVQVPARNRLPG